MQKLVANLLTINIIILSLKIAGLNYNAHVKDRKYCLNVAESKSKTKNNSFAQQTLVLHNKHTTEPETKRIQHGGEVASLRRSRTGTVQPNNEQNNENRIFFI
ncbi:hypothetical protein AAHE18_19G161500 [Arachis hypogaea]